MGVTYAKNEREREEKYREKRDGERVRYAKNERERERRKI